MNPLTFSQRNCRAFGTIDGVRSVWGPVANLVFRLGLITHDTPASYNVSAPGRSSPYTLSSASPQDPSLAARLAALHTRARAIPMYRAARAAPSAVQASFGRWRCQNAVFVGRERWRWSRGKDRERRGLDCDRRRLRGRCLVLAISAVMADTKGQHDWEGGSQVSGEDKVRTTATQWPAQCFGVSALDH